MSFQSGRVTFCRYRVEGDAPRTADATALATLAEHAFQEREIGAPDEVEAGWTTGDHLFDTQFSYEKNGYGVGGELLLFALRIDTHRVPAEVRHAYKRMNEQSLAAGNPSGFASKRQKRDAGDTAAQQVREDLAAGRYRKSKAVPLLWDLQRRVLYCTAVGNTVGEQLGRMFRESFNLQLAPISSGSLAGELLRAGGKGRDYEDLQPSPFTPAPAAARVDEEEGGGPRRDAAVPRVPWAESSIDLKDFLGNEFLLWLWWTTEAAEGLVEVPGLDGGAKGSDIALTIDKALDMDCAWGVTGKQTLRTSLDGQGPTRLPEAGEALAGGKWPRKMSLIVADVSGGSGEQWELSLQGDRWVVGGASMPEAPEAQSPRELTEARLGFTRRLAETLDGLFGVFLRERVGGSWPSRRAAIRRWIETRSGK